MDSLTRIPSTTQQVAYSTAASLPVATPVLRTTVTALSGDVMTAAAASSTGATLGNLLPATTEQATGSAVANNDQVTLMGQTVGASLAESGDAVNWRDFSSQATSTLQAAGYSDTDIQTYLGAVKQTYQQVMALPAPVSTATAATSTATTGGTSSAGATTDPSNLPDGLLPNNGDLDGVPYGSSTNVVGPATSSTVAMQIDPSQLPAVGTPAGSFAALAQQAYNSEWAVQGSSVNIDSLVANTQTEMDNMGYSTDQVDNYMIGLFQAYNAVAMPSPAVVTPDPSTDGSTGSVTEPYDPEPSYDPLLNNGDDGY